MPGCISTDRGGGHPGFLPYASLRDQLLGLPTADWVERCSVLAARRHLCSAAGVPLSFVAGEASGGALGYEAAILQEGRIACRLAGRGALHDLHNALVWLTFPQVKALLNRLHLAGIEAAGPGRGRVRDRVTLLDESGLLWVSGSSRLDEQLQAGRWRQLLVTNREQVRDRILPVIVGHGLLEKLAAPYKAMTAHCLVCPVGSVQERDGVGLQGNATFGPEQLAAIDAVAARCLASALDAPAGPHLAPLPVLGLPGWDPANLDASYYDDARVFRGR